MLWVERPRSRGISGASQSYAAPWISFSFAYVSSSTSPVGSRKIDAVALDDPHALLGSCGRELVTLQPQAVRDVLVVVLLVDHGGVEVSVIASTAPMRGNGSSSKPSTQRAISPYDFAR